MYTSITYNIVGTEHFNNMKASTCEVTQKVELQFLLAR